MLLSFEVQLKCAVSRWHLYFKPESELTRRFLWRHGFDMRKGNVTYIHQWEVEFWNKHHISFQKSLDNL